MLRLTLTTLPTISMPLPDARLRFLLACATAGLFVCLSSAGALAMAPVTIERSDPRLFAYQLGDVIGERVLIRLAGGYSLDPQSLPRAGKRSGWFMIRSAQVLSSTPYSDGTSGVQLLIEVQLVNSPKTARALTVPPIALHFKGPEAREETIPGLTIDAVPLGTGEVRTGLPDIREPRAPARISLDTERGRLRWSLWLAAAFAAWFAVAMVFRRLGPKPQRPYADAARDLRTLLKSSETLEGARAAVQRVHRAFDQSAGHRLFGEGVPAYCARMGADASLQDRTIAFFALSQTLFFRTGAAEIPPGLGQELTELTHAWQRFEKRHPQAAGHGRLMPAEVPDAT